MIDIEKARTRCLLEQLVLCIVVEYVVSCDANAPAGHRGAILNDDVAFSPRSKYKLVRKPPMKPAMKILNIYAHIEDIKQYRTPRRADNKVDSTYRSTSGRRRTEFEILATVRPAVHIHTNT